MFGIEGGQYGYGRGCSVGRVDGAGVSNELAVVLVALPPEVVASGRSLEVPTGPWVVIVGLVSTAALLTVEVVAGVLDVETKRQAQDKQPNKYSVHRLIIKIQPISYSVDHLGTICPNKLLILLVARSIGLSTKISLTISAWYWGFCCSWFLWRL